MVVNCRGAGSAGPQRRQQASATRWRSRRNSWTLDTILAGLDVLSSTRARLRNSNHGRVLVEMALVRLGRLDDLVSLTQLAQGAGQRASWHRQPAYLGGAMLPARRTLQKKNR